MFRALSNKRWYWATAPGSSSSRIPIPSGRRKTGCSTSGGRRWQRVSVRPCGGSTSSGSSSSTRWPRSPESGSSPDGKRWLSSGGLGPRRGSRTSGSERSRSPSCWAPSAGRSPRRARARRSIRPPRASTGPPTPSSPRGTPPTVSGSSRTSLSSGSPGRTSSS